MDSDEVKRLMQKIRDRGHQVYYDARTRAELDERGRPGLAEEALGAVPVKEAHEEDMLVVCTVITPGQMLTMPDNKTGPCSWGCGRTVQYRPWVSLPVVCLYCVAERSAEDN